MLFRRCWLSGRRGDKRKVEEEGERKVEGRKLLEDVDYSRALMGLTKG